MAGEPGVIWVFGIILVVVLYIAYTDTTKYR